jgi:hypothetical protein
MRLCPFCTSGLLWNACSCHWAIQAQRHGMMDAQRRFAIEGNRVAAAKSSAAVEAKRAQREVEEHDRATRAPGPYIAPGEPKPAIPAVPALKDDDLAPPGECAKCDARRAKHAARVSRWRAKRAAAKDGAGL